MHNQIKIGGRKIGKNFPPLVIPEIGINHEGDFNIAKRTIKSAALAGADAIKLQIFNPKTLAQKESKKTSYWGLAIPY